MCDCQSLAVIVNDRVHWAADDSVSVDLGEFPRLGGLVGS